VAEGTTKGTPCPRGRAPRCGVLVAAALAATGFALEREASACGGCLQPPPPPTQTVSDITDERMLLAVSTTQSTLYDQIEYSGSPSTFAWVLPIRGTVTVGLSADILFDAIDTLTATQIVPPPQNCPSPNCSSGSGCGSSANVGLGSYSAAGGSETPPVQVLTQANVGPYETVQLHSTDASALDDWLTQNGYDIPAAVQPILDAYASEGFDFLAMKLLPGEGIQAMRPVRVTTAGASLSLPLRMASIGTGAVTGITIWVVAEGRYEPQNFQFFYIPTTQIVWDWSTSSSNYTTLRTQQEAAFNNAAWEIESSIDLNEQVITNAILSGGQSVGNGLSATTPSDPAQDYLPIGAGEPDGGGDDAGDGGYAGDGGDDAGDSGYESAEQVRADDIAALFAGMAGPTVRVTRIRSDIAQTAMTKDFILQAASDQSELSNVRDVTQSVNLTCNIYSGCSIVGTGTPAQAQASVNGHGCAASTRGFAGSGAGLGALGGILGLVLGRAIRSRRRAARSRRRS
jgi:hypothetical protein